MSGLSGMLSTTARSLDAQRYGLDSAGQNIANVARISPASAWPRASAGTPSASTPLPAFRRSLGFRSGLDTLAYELAQQVNIAAGSVAATPGDNGTAQAQQIDKLRDGVFAVSLDEEAAPMMRFQRPYEANARFFTTVNQTLDVLLNLGR